LASCGYQSNVQPLISGSPADRYVDEFLAAEARTNAEPLGSRAPGGATDMVLRHEPGIPLLADGCHSVWLTSPSGQKRILTVREGDPGSGSSFGFSWSKDGQAAFIFGGHSGIDCAGPVSYDKLRIIYTLADGVAWELPKARGRPTKS
jgi:hypothetical protein